ncbi:MAG TPA: RNA polymerase sigma-54 factor [Planctomycetaceae bacterium]|nr:RNA polymerase sigma-54 factor [Blastopirellula sp.]HAY79379.1 RNA polymerase sigma-54 factor [Planctomycetaceae bacterium]
MRLSLSPQLTQTQTQKLAPRMIQSMEILQLPLLALQERIEQELNENPLLELQEQDPALPEETSERENPDAPAEAEKELVVDDADNTDDFERLLDLDREVPDYFDESPRMSSNRMEEVSDRKHDVMANAESRPQSLNDYLLEQLHELELEPQLLRMCERIISALDATDGGYLKTSLSDLLPISATAEDQALAEDALEIVQSLDPPGIAARDLRECLLLQLTPDMDYFEELQTLIGTHLEDLRDNRLPLIEKKTGYSIGEIQDVWEQLRKLNPKPAAKFAEVRAPSVTPDVFVERGEDGKYKVVLEDERTPRLRISKYYRDRIRNGTATPEEKEFIKRKINSAQWLIESIEQRRSTLTRVAQAIVDYQQQFLDDGPEHIQPLKMQQIADQVGVHVTTVSRAVDDKWMQTPRGIFALRRFFVGGTVSDQGEDVAWDRIRLKLQELVDNEDKTKPHSDDALVELMKAAGFKVARRTITKYRQRMNIPSSRQRRDWSKK